MNSCQVGQQVAVRLQGLNYSSKPEMPEQIFITIIIKDWLKQKDPPLMTRLILYRIRTSNSIGKVSVDLDQITESVKPTADFISKCFV